MSIKSAAMYLDDESVIIISISNRPVYKVYKVYDFYAEQKA